MEDESVYGESCERTPMLGFVSAPADPRGGFNSNPSFSMIRFMDNGATVNSDGAADGPVLG